MFTKGEPDLSPKQTQLLKLCRSKTGRKKYILLSGTRWAGKSIGGMHTICDHLWNTKDASVLVLCYTAGTAATSGIWTELTEKILPEWIAADFGMEWAEKGEPRIHGATKKMMCAVINKHGGVSKLELDSLDDEREVEKRYKSRYYSMVYWSEASEFHEELSMTTLMACLRIVGLPSDEHILLIDVNPAKEGTDHFLYKYFYEMRIADDLDADEKPIQACLHLIEWTMDDNPYLTDDDKSVIKAAYKTSPSLWSRYVLGLWVKVVEKGLFTKQFSLATHVVGNPNDREPEILIPMEGCSELITGHDEGGVNPVSYIIEKCTLHTDVKDFTMFRYLDELAFIGEEISPEEFTLLFVAKMDFWENEIGGEVRWRHWSDRSALDHKQSIAQRTVADEMFSVSQGRIKLEAVEKGRGSVGNRIRLWRKLLIQGRIVISALCPKLIEMNENINCGKVPDTIATHSIYKHPFDAATYPVAKECWDELQDDIHVIRTKERPRDGSNLVEVRM